jgi:signal transduction histidine kinase
VARKQENAAKHADAVVDRARDNADAVLDAARDNADAVLDAAPDAATIHERGIADEVLRGERDSADETLRQERAEYADTRKRFLPLERESTDRSLLTERIHSDDALANRDDFLAIVAHDLRDLIGGIVMSSTVLARRASQDEEGKKTLEETRRIERYAARMNRLIGDLVDVASIDAGKLAITSAIQDAAALIAEVQETFQATAAAKGILLGTQIRAAPLLATLDHDRILQVLANLISNALKFTPRGGRVTICGEGDAAGVTLSVVDTGCGIPDDAHARIFERFSQVGKSDHRGLGLGLYIARCIVEAHGGRIWAESQPGPGSRICFTLPRVAPLPARAG